MDLFRTKSVERTLDETREEGRSLKRNLNTWDLALMCVAVAVGAGIFSVGAQAAAYYAGPSSIISFLIAGIVCGGTVLCYAEFTSMVPAAGSAYTFTYTTVGEFVAWIIGWDLVLEMLMAGAVVAKYWGVYLSDFTRLMGWNLRMTVQLGPVSFDWAPFLIIAFFTALLVIGTQLSARVDGTLTAIKIGIVLFIIVAGLFYIKWSNFVPFIPHSAPASSVRQGVSSGLMEQPLWQWISGRKATAYGVPGIFSGAALVFFAFVGFDAVATASEEAKNPEKTVPHGIILGLSIIIVLYMAVAFVTTGIVSYKTLAKAPNPSLSVAFELAGASWAAKIISIGIVIGMATVVMVLLLGLTRILFAMSRDGLLPRNLSKTNKRGTPAALQIGGSGGHGLHRLLLRRQRPVGHGQYRDPVRLPPGFARHPDHAQPPAGPEARLHYAWQSLAAHSHRRRLRLHLHQPVRADVDPLPGLAFDRVRRLLRVLLPACWYPDARGGRWGVGRGGFGRCQLRGIGGRCSRELGKVQERSLQNEEGVPIMESDEGAFVGFMDFVDFLKLTKSAGEPNPGPGHLFDSAGPGV